MPTPSGSRIRHPYPKMHAEQRWDSRGRMKWCVIQKGIVYPISASPFRCDEAMCAYKQRGVAECLAPSTSYERKSPPRTRADQWLRANDTRHAEYSGQ